MKLQNHYKDGFFDVCAEHGFLPVKDPIVSLPSTYADVQKILDDMPVVLPNGEHGLLHHEGEIMKAIEALENHLEEVKKEDDLFVIQALFRSYGFLTSAYLLEPSYQQFRLDGTYGKARNVLPALCLTQMASDQSPFFGLGGRMLSGCLDDLNLPFPI